MTNPRPFRLLAIAVLLGVLAAVLILIIEPGLNRPAAPDTLCGTVPSTIPRSSP